MPRKGEPLSSLEEGLLSVITDRSLDESQKISQISILIRDRGASDFSWILPLLPRSLHNRAKIIIHSIQNKVSINDSGQVILPTGQNLGSILDLIKYTVTPGSFSKFRPLEASVWVQFLKENKAPRSGFAPDKYDHKPQRTTKIQMRDPVGTAVVKAHRPKIIWQAFDN